MPPKKKEGNVQGKKKKKKISSKVDEKKTEWDELNLDALQATVTSMQEKLGEVQKQRRYEQAEFDTMQHFYDNTVQSIHEAEMEVQLKELDLEQLHHECSMEIRAYQNKVTFLRQEHAIALQDMKGDGTNDLVQLQCEVDGQLSELLESKRLLEDELSQTELARNADLSKLKDDIKHEFEAHQGELSNELQSLKQHLRATQDGMKQDLLLQLTVEKHETRERKDLFLKELSHRHEECKQHIISYYSGITQDQLAKISTLRARIAAFKTKRDNDIETAQEMTIQADNMEKPLVDAREGVSLLKAKLKKRERNLNSLKDTKQQIILVKKRIAALERECSDLQKSCTQEEKEHEQLILKFDDAAIEANQTSTGKAKILENKIKTLARAVATDEEQLYRVLTAASLAPGEPESISAMLHGVLEQKNRQIYLLHLMIAKATKDNMDFFTQCRTRLSDEGCSVEEVTKILGKVVAR